ncbi:MAG TPA: toast rack family protein [Acidobacteriota bacterium]|nr:toast rack family protein [Acidobacteriota bacterium]
MSLTRTKIFGAILLLVGLAAACDEPRNMIRETKTVALEGAARAEVGLHMGAGELRLQAADQASLLEASFEFNRERNRPDVSYRLFGDKGILEVRPARRRGINFGTSRNRWDLTLGRTVPLDLSIDLGAGHSDIDLRGLKLERVEVDMGVGEVNLDLRGPHASGFLVKIDGGVGSAKLSLPGEVGVRVKVDGGLGSVNAHGLTKQGGAYVNDAYGRSPVTIEIDIDAGIGSLDLDCETSTPIKT